MVDDKKIHTRKCGLCGKINQWEHGKKHSNCQKCNAVYWDKPSDECILFNLQEDYLKTRDQRILGKMYLVMFKYAEKIILKQLPYKYDETKLEEKIEDTVTTIIKYYLTREDYKVENSFGGTLFGPSRQELYKKSQQDIDSHEVSYDNTYSDDADTTFKDKISSEDLHDDDKYTKELVEIANKEFLVKELSKFIDRIYTTISNNYSVNEAILSLIILHHYIDKKDDEFIDKFYKNFGTELQSLVEKEKLILLEYIKEISTK